MRWDKAFAIISVSAFAAYLVWVWRDADRSGKLILGPLAVVRRDQFPTIFTFLRWTLPVLAAWLIAALAYGLLIQP